MILSITQVKGLAPSQILEILVAPSGNWKAASMAACVCKGETFVAINKPTAITNAPIMTDLKTFPLQIGATIATINGIVARSPKGNTLFPLNCRKSFHAISS